MHLPIIAEQTTSTICITMVGVMVSVMTTIMMILTVVIIIIIVRMVMIIMIPTGHGGPGPEGRQGPWSQSHRLSPSAFRVFARHLDRPRQPNLKTFSGIHGFLTKAASEGESPTADPTPFPDFQSTAAKERLKRHKTRKFVRSQLFLRLLQVRWEESCLP